MGSSGLYGDFKKIHRGVEQLVAHRAHNPEVVGSNPTPATKKGQSKMGCPFSIYSFC